MASLYSNIIAVKLSNNKYYILKTNKSDFNLDYDFNYKDIEFTNINKPLFIDKIVKSCDNFDLDKIVKIYMCNYGINNVRGGSYQFLELTNTQINFLQSEICTACPEYKYKTEEEISLIKINNNYPRNYYKTPVKAFSGYIYFSGCCICGKNCIGRGSTPSCYNNIITNPPYKQNDRITELMICCSCAKSIKGKELLDTNSELYKVSEVILKDNF
tara:strand:+ start:919 stop:1563 length:645 start_codon:yes stop_codon:yes gene_type:complete